MSEQQNQNISEKSGDQEVSQNNSYLDQEFIQQQQEYLLQQQQIQQANQLQEENQENNSQEHQEENQQQYMYQDQDQDQNSQDQQAIQNNQYNNIQQIDEDQQDQEVDESIEQLKLEAFQNQGSETSHDQNLYQKNNQDESEKYDEQQQFQQYEDEQNQLQFQQQQGIYQQNQNQYYDQNDEDINNNDNDNNENNYQNELQDNISSSDYNNNIYQQNEQLQYEQYKQLQQQQQFKNLQKKQNQQNQMQNQDQQEGPEAWELQLVIEQHIQHIKQLKDRGAQRENLISQLKSSNQELQSNLEKVKMDFYQKDQECIRLLQQLESSKYNSVETQQQQISDNNQENDYQQLSQRQQQNSQRLPGHQSQQMSPQIQKNDQQNLYVDRSNQIQKNQHNTSSQYLGNKKVIDDEEYYEQQRKIQIYELEIEQLNNELLRQRKDVFEMRSIIEEKESEQLELIKRNEDFHISILKLQDEIVLQQSRNSNHKLQEEKLRSQTIQLGEDLQQIKLNEKYESEKLLSKCNALLEVNQELREQNEILIQQNLEKDDVKAENFKLKKNLKYIKEIEMHQYRCLVDDLIKELDTKDFMSVHQLIIKEHRKQQKFMNSFIDVMKEAGDIQSINNDKDKLQKKSQRNPSIKQCWEWFKTMFNDYIRLRKEQNLDITLSNFLMKSLEIKKKREIYPSLQKKMQDFDILDRIASRIKKLFKLQWCNSYLELEKYMEIEFQSMVLRQNK